MKLKRLPEDFQVVELTDVVPTGGDYALYRLTKRSLGTPEAIDRLLTRMKVQRHRISYGGLKDKHAHTTQHITIRFGAPHGLVHKEIELDYLGQMDRAFTPQHIAGNRFRIVIRDLSAVALDRAQSALSEVAASGFPNYFDDQRFGSLGASNDFVARAWCLGEYERALWLALADPNSDDRKEEKEQKAILREHWGKWRDCKAALERSNRRSIVTYLADKPPESPDYRGAFARLRVDMRGLYLSAFQSHLWNQLLSQSLCDTVPVERRFPVELKTGPVPFFLHLDPGPQLDRIEAVVRANGLELRELRVKHPRDSFFSKGSRPAIILPSEVSESSEGDDLYPGRKKIALSFELPRGSYATMLVKRITEC
ncbi:MAG: tRNA pseudouridine(13) synthase TruD [Planctomycetota bacterium]|nr:tRNA pseudouridine(13) synthase TruD [Planctomycetota bacterium]